MKCPVCKETNLLMTERHGIEVDYCPNCRGIWLDRGELDKIIEMGSMQYKDNEDYSDSHEKKTNGNHKEGHYDKKKKKESFLSNIFDVFGGD